MTTRTITDEEFDLADQIRDHAYERWPNIDPMGDDMLGAINVDSFVLRHTHDPAQALDMALDHLARRLPSRAWRWVAA